MNETTMESVSSIDHITIRKSAYFFIKRIFDIFVGFIGTLFLIPLTIIIKIAYMISGDFESIIFKQARIGKNGKTIYIYKYRSMVPNADEVLFELLKNDPELAKEYKKYKKLENDPRITKVGKFIRKTSLDEFPQFFNVLMGDMSVVGPRPYLHRELKDMRKYYNSVIACKPGVTGYWQVNGRSKTDFDTRLQMDEYYSENRKTTLDFKLFIKTFATVLEKDGAK